MTGSNHASIEQRAHSLWGRFLRALIGGLAGFLSVSLLFRFGAPALPQPIAADAIAAMAVACVYVVMGVFVVLGTLLPTAGAQLLNVADADELRDERKLLVMSSLSSILGGLGLLALAFAGRGGGLLAPPAALAIAAGAIVLAAVLYWWGGRGQDEYRRLVNAEASQSALALISLLFGGWAMLAQLGYAAMFTPLGFLSGVFALVLLAAFWVTGRRGMLNAR